jgi:hypothetical protein
MTCMAFWRAGLRYFVLGAVAGTACGESASKDSGTAAGRGGSSAGSAAMGGGSLAGTTSSSTGGEGAGGSGAAGRGGSAGSGGSPGAGTSGEGLGGEGGEAGSNRAGGGAGGSAGKGAAGSAGVDGGGEGGDAGEGGASALLNMLIMFDRSRSMLVCVDGSEPGSTGCETGPSRWDVAAADLNSFLADPAAAGLGVALRFFPHDLPATGCTGGSMGVCDVAACAVPLVELERLTTDPTPTDAHEAALASAIAASGPDLVSGSSGGTPIYAALAGALSWATAYQSATSGQTTVVVFVTDGEPNGCNEDWRDIRLLAIDALEDANVRTFAVGLTDSNGAGVGMNDLNGLAVAGGTDQAYFVADGANASAGLFATLNAIRGRL